VQGGWGSKRIGLTLFILLATTGFHNDTTLRYNAEAAKLYGERTVAFCEEYLRG
jgi:hypothetical protein